MNNQFNCRLLTISSILKRKIPDIDIVWGQSTLIMHNENGKSILSPNYLTDYEFLKHMVNIDTIECQYRDYKTFFESALKFIIEGYTLFFHVDLFYMPLPFNNDYNKNHNSHYIEVVGLNKKNIKYIDHFYNVSGSIKHTEMKKALAISKGIFNFTIFQTDKHTFLKGNEQIYKVILFNVSVMKNGAIYKQSKINKCIESYGVEVLKEILKNFDNFLLNSLNDRLYKDLSNISTSRYRYANLIKEINRNSTEITLLFTLIEELAQKYKIAANLVLKMKISNQNLSNNIYNILAECLEMEKRLIYSTDYFIKNNIY